jgi:hypothetical protein
MSDNTHQPNNWLEEFEDMANERLGEGSACKQIHPIIEAWYSKLMEGEPPESRDSVLQAIACLSTEILIDMPEDLFEVFANSVDQTEVACWVQEVLMIGRAFQMALQSGQLDDL